MHLTSGGVDRVYELDVPASYDGTTYAVVFGLHALTESPNFVEDRVAADVHRRTWQHCKAATQLYIVDGGGHAWPGKPVPQFEAEFGPGTTEIDATSLTPTFFFGR